MPEVEIPLGKYFEEFNVGDEYTTPARTVTEADVVGFASLTGDFTPVHTDEEWCKKHSPFKTRIAHGLLTVAYGIGLVNRLPLFCGTVMAFLDMSLKLTAPVMIGDTIAVKVKVLDKRETSKPDRGVVTFNNNYVNQRNESVAQSTNILMMARKPR